MIEEGWFCSEFNIPAGKSPAEFGDFTVAAAIALGLDPLNIPAPVLIAPAVAEPAPWLAPPAKA